MSEKLKFYKGFESDLPINNIEPGALYHCIDTGNTYRGTDANTLELFSTATGKIIYDDNGNKNNVFDGEVSYFQGDIYVNGTDLKDTNTQKVATEQYVKDLLGIEEEFSVNGELVELNTDIKTGTELNVVSKIHRDSTWGESNKLVLHQVSGTNFVDLSSYLGGIGKTFEKNGLTATINEDGTLSVTGTNTSTDWTQVLSITDWNSENSKKVYPAGTYTITSGLTVKIRAAQYPNNVIISGLAGNLQNKFVAPQPFRVVGMFYAVAGGASVDKTIPFGLFQTNSIPTAEFKYTGNIYTATFDQNVYEGEYNWTTGELKDANGNTVVYYAPQPIRKLPGTNYFWTGFGENIISNVSNNNLEKVVISLGVSAPEETVPSICDFTLKPITKNYSINVFGDSRNYFEQGNVFYGMEVPLVTTRGKVVAYNTDGEVAYTAAVPELIGYKGIFDIMTGNEITKRWSDRFYITREPDSIETIDDGNGSSNSNPNTIAIWEFSKKDFEKFGLPIENIDMSFVSPYFICTTEEKLATQKLSYADVYRASFSYNANNDKYILKCRARSYSSRALYSLTSAYFCYPLKEEVNRTDTMLSMYIDSGYVVSFEQDNAFDTFLEYSLTQDWCPFMNDTGGALWNPNTKPSDAEAAKPLMDVTPNVGIFVPRSVADALYEAEHIAKRLNNRDIDDRDIEPNSYQWIGKGDGTTDYTEKIQNKLIEVHNTTKGGTIYLGPGTYPISGSLVIYDNTRIIGDGQTVIEQTADNTHAIILNGSYITLRDLTIKLSGKCIENTACVFANSNNHAEYGERDERYPENMYVQYCTIQNVILQGTYGLSRNSQGYYYLSDEANAYRGYGTLGRSIYFNFLVCENVTGTKLFSVIGSGSASRYNITVTDSRHGIYSGITNSVVEITGHSYYGKSSETTWVNGSEDLVHSESLNSIYLVRSFDTQYFTNVVYFGTKSQANVCIPMPAVSVDRNSPQVHEVSGNITLQTVDLGRGNALVGYNKNMPYAVGNRIRLLSGLTLIRSELDGGIHNALAGAGVWGNISSNIDWNEDGISIMDVCRYPKENSIVTDNMHSIISSVAPSEDGPIELVIDISDRPVATFPSLWIQFDHRYVASDLTISFDTKNQGEYNYVQTFSNNTDTVFWYLPTQLGTNEIIYRIKISVTKALSIPDFKYENSAQTEYTIDYNPDNLIGIVNIGMPQNEPFGRAFLGECGGSLYGNVDMHQNTLKNLPTPIDAGDAVSKAYVDAQLGNIGTNDFVLIDKTTNKKYSLYVDNGKLTLKEEQK